MSRRTTKKFIFGFFYLLIIGIIGWGIYIGARSAPSCFDGRLNQDEKEVDCGGVCESCDIKRLRPIQIKSAQQFIVDGQLTTLTQFANPNSGYGATQFSYIMRFLDRNGAVVNSKEETSFIYPGEIKYLFMVEDNVRNNEIERVEVAVKENISWKAISDFPKPKVSLRNINITLNSTEKRIELTGAVTNNSSFLFKDANIVGILESKFEIPIAASKTALKDIIPGEERSFRIVIPEVINTVVTLENINIFVEVIR